MSPERVSADEPAPSWWQVYPELWGVELAALEAAGLTWNQFDLPGGATRKVGTVRLPADCAWTAGTRAEGVELEIAVAFPSTYPWFEPTVWLLGDPLPWLRRHRTPGGQLCLMHAEHWRPGMTLVSLLASQLPRLLTASDPDAERLLARGELARLEVQGPESSSLHRGAEWLCLVDSAWRIPPEISSGYLLPAMPPAVSPALGIGLINVGHIARIYDTAGAELAGFADMRLPDPHFPLAGRWLRLDAPPGEPNLTWQQIEPHLPPALSKPIQSPSPHDINALMTLAEQIYFDTERRDAILTAAVRAYMRHYARAWRQFHGKYEVIGLLHPDETAWRTTDWTWSFLLRHRGDRRRKWQIAWAATGYAGTTDLRTRAPQATALAKKVVTVIGVGAIGSRVAEGLAQAGVGELRLIDRDLLEPGNLTRHTTGLRHVGLAKSGAVADQLRDRAPATVIYPALLQIGAAGLHVDEANDHALMQEYVADSDLIIDATANPAVSRYLAALCLAADTAFLHVSATAGGWGGLVVRIDPHTTTGCWSCLEHHRAEHTIPAPPADPGEDMLAPAGCAMPTFVGAAADLDTVALHAVRLATEQLADSNTGTALRTADIFTATLRGPAGPIPVQWQTARLLAHAACPIHGRPAACSVNQVMPSPGHRWRVSRDHPTAGAPASWTA